MAEVVKAKPFESEEEYQDWVATCASIEAKIKAAKRRGQAALWDMAEALFAFNEEAGWRGCGYESLGEWLADPDITMQKRSYYRLVGAWREMHVLRKVPVPTLAQLDLSKVDIALPALKEGKALVSDVIADAEAMGARDMRIKYAAEIEPMPEGEVEPSGIVDGDEPMPDDESPPDIVVEDYGTEMVPRGVAQTLCLVLENILALYGNPKRKTVSNEMRVQIENALALAHEHGLGGPDV